MTSNSPPNREHVFTCVTFAYCPLNRFVIEHTLKEVTVVFNMLFNENVKK